MLRTIQTANPTAERIWRAAGIAVTGVVAATLLIRAVAYAAFDVPQSFPLLQVGPAILWIAALVIGLAAVRAYMERRSSDAASSFLNVALRSLAVLLFVDVALMVLHILPGTQTSAILTLMSMQGTAAALSIYLLNVR